MNKTTRVLIIDDDGGLREALVWSLQDAGYQVKVADGVASIASVLREERFDGVLLHLPLNEGDEPSLIEEVRAMSADGSSAPPPDGDPNGDLDLRRNVKRLEHRLIARALVLARGNRA